MATLGGFLQGIGQQAGYAIDYSRQAAREQVGVDLAKQQLEAGQLAIDTQKGQAASRLSTMSELKGALSEAKGSKEQVAALTKAKFAAAAGGDWQSMQAVSSLLKDKENEDDRAQAKVVEAAQAHNEAVGSAANTYLSTKSPAAAKAFIDALGGDPSQLPPPGPKFDALVGQHALDASGKAQQGEFLAQLREKKVEQKQAQENSDRAFQAGRADARNTEMHKNRSEALSAQEFAFKKSQAAALTTDPSQVATINRLAQASLDGEPLPKNMSKPEALAVEKRKTELISAGAKQEHFAEGVNPKMYSQRQTTAGQFVLSELQNVAGMSLGQTAGTFSDLAKGHGITTSLTQQFGNKVTANEAAQYNASMVPLGLELATLAYGGQKPPVTVVEEFRDMIRARSGESTETALYKLSLGVNAARSALAHAPPANAADKQAKDAIKVQLSKIPTPTEVLTHIRSTGHSVQGLEELNNKFKSVSQEFSMGSAPVATAPTAAWKAATDVGWK